MQNEDETIDVTSWALSKEEQESLKRVADGLKQAQYESDAAEAEEKMQVEAAEQESKRQEDLRKKIQALEQELGLNQVTNEALEHIELGSKVTATGLMVAIFTFLSKISGIGRVLDAIKGAMAPLLFLFAGATDVAEAGFVAGKFAQAKNKNSGITGETVVAVTKGILVPVAVGLALSGFVLAAHILFPIALGLVFGHNAYKFVSGVREWHKLKNAPDTTENSLIKAQVKKDIEHSIVGMVISAVVIAGIIGVIAVPGVAPVIVGVLAIAVAAVLVGGLAYHLYHRFKKKDAKKPAVDHDVPRPKKENVNVLGHDKNRKNGYQNTSYYRNTFSAVAMPCITPENKITETVKVITEIVNQIAKLRDEIKQDANSIKEKVWSEKEKRENKIMYLEKLVSMTYLSLHPTDQQTVKAELFQGDIADSFASMKDKAKNDYLSDNRSGAFLLLEHAMEKSAGGSQSYFVHTSYTKTLFEKARNIITAPDSVEVRNAELLKEVRVEQERPYRLY